jgi:hypothetical protein
MKAYINKGTNYICDYDLKYNWPDLTIIKPMYDKDNDYKKINYSFDIYLNKPLTCFHVEADNYEACEEKAWEQYNKIIKCDKHELKAYRESYYCLKCGLNKLSNEIINSLKEFYSFK